MPLVTVRCLTLSYGGLLGDPSDDSVSKLVSSVVSSLKKGDADLACFEYLDDDSTMFRIVRQVGGALQRDQFPTCGLDRWTVRLPGSFAEFIGRLSRNTRHNLKRYSKRFQDAFGNRITIREFRDPINIETVLADCEVVARNTYHRGLGVGFVNDDETRRLMTLAACRGWLRAYVSLRRRETVGLSGMDACTEGPSALGRPDTIRFMASFALECFFYSAS